MLKKKFKKKRKFNQHGMININYYMLVGQKLQQDLKKDLR